VVTELLDVRLYVHGFLVWGSRGALAHEEIAPHAAASLGA
jgi:hypothetical protein